MHHNEKPDRDLDLSTRGPGLERALGDRERARTERVHLHAGRRPLLRECREHRAGEQEHDRERHYRTLHLPLPR